MDETEHVSLCEALDRLLNKGAVVMGEVTISVANIDLIYLSLRAMLASVETARQAMNTDFTSAPPLRLAAGTEERVGVRMDR
ncbi:MAG: gas vesicle protein [Desulfobacteraceae bacterium]|nr:gas vesicle protein [Desulfobacteraceae bacterium]MCF8050312.1 gas vesicle protein [Desulfobacterales bacterium]MCF8080428.1 gas vesicle protein [Desulfobacterales bacterium]